MLTRNEVRYALLPLWFMNTKYKGKSYTFVINGQTGKMSGSLPVSWGKFFGALASITALVAAFSMLIGFFAL